MIENLIIDISNNFSFSYMIIVNILTYFVIKSADYLNGDAAVPIIHKRIILVIVTLAMFIVYKFYSDISIIVLINSAIAAPVFWSWVLRPILKKLKLNYKQFDKYIN